jgi:hypothetical protein
MLLLSHRYLTNDQRSFAYPPHEAVKLVSRALANGQDINGLNDLRAWLPINRDSEILEQIKKGQWVLLRRGARAFRWADFAESVQEQRAIYDYAYAPVASRRSASPIIASQKPLTPELIAVAGSQHDNSSGNKMMFIAQAVRELAEFRRHRQELHRTLVVFTPAYSHAMLDKARESAQIYGADFVSVTNAQAFIDYLNKGKDRQQSPIEHLSLFSHGVPQQVAFGYQLTEAAQLSLSVENYEQISADAFSRSALIESYACRTGMANSPELWLEEGVQIYPQTNESLAQLLANHTRLTVRAFIRRSDYKNTWGTFEERQLLKGCLAINNTELIMCRELRKLFDERASITREHDFAYQNIGATSPVISGGSPKGVPEGFHEFLPR